MKKIFVAAIAVMAAAAMAYAGTGKISVTSMDISPNPFSPGKTPGGAVIKYNIDTNTGASLVRTTIVIYNPAGKAVRTVLYDGLRSTVSENKIDAWDGKDDKGKLCMNGRYILRIEVEDTSGKKQNLYSIVLAK